MCAILHSLLTSIYYSCIVLYCCFFLSVRPRYFGCCSDLLLQASQWAMAMFCSSVVHDLLWDFGSALMNDERLCFSSPECCLSLYITTLHSMSSMHLHYHYALYGMLFNLYQANSKCTVKIAAYYVVSLCNLIAFYCCSVRLSIAA
jgi:hypothetical protein